MLTFIRSSRRLKGLLLERGLQLYRQVCAVIPPGIQVRTEQQYRGGDWRIDRFERHPCFGAGASLTEFLAFREKTVASLLNPHRI